MGAVGSCPDAPPRKYYVFPIGSGANDHKKEKIRKRPKETSAFFGGFMEKQWVVYMIECKDGSLYTGITDNLPKRLQAHRTGKGAKYTKGRAPLILRYLEDCEDHSQALRREIEIKKLTRQEKIALCQTQPKSLEEF